MVLKKTSLLKEVYFLRFWALTKSIKLGTLNVVKIFLNKCQIFIYIFIKAPNEGWQILHEMWVWF